MWGIETREISAVPRECKPLRWVLLSSESATSFSAAWRLIEYYERRPLIEEYHQCLKTGCQVESRPYQTANGLEPAIGLACVVAVRLLQLKLIARAEPERSVTEVVPERWMAMLSHVRPNKRRRIRTVREFFRSLAGLGGFLDRKCDGESGWQTIWRGPDVSLQMLRGAGFSGK